MADDKQKPIIFLVHGAWHRPLHYRPLIHALQAKGFTVLAPPLASSGYDDSVDGKTYHDDVKRVRDVLLPFLDEGRIAIGIGHSYGGVPLTVAIQGHTTAERVAKGLKGGVASAIYISATPVIAKDISMYESVGNKYTTDWLHEVSEKRLPLKPDIAPDAFYFDVEKSIRDEAMAHVCHQSRGPFEVPVVCTPKDLDIPKTYVVCLNDKIFLKDIQAYAADNWGAKALEIESGHSPWLIDSHREWLVNLVGEEAAKV
ncbi:hypothetical protein MRS44_011095 [Fusarium solani]|uniref:Alpha/beta hydrolase fold-1 n=1 Tax=Fusarium solani TaxID=169388 RepID=A0A9P9KU57_FUSSL|nr:Alpha/beta hydrolase fold-1 [Fusarium solani]KAH7268633.1 Alpha/beta hydrolase fold-1 [Fusarium solani]KAJ3460228.1 hypothetical protein MRS44_011095 [Fusarium solani]KAJ4214909.1 hypothetical protein NW759_009931 [Fusarium solani]